MFNSRNLFCWFVFLISIKSFEFSLTPDFDFDEVLYKNSAKYSNEPFDYDDTLEILYETILHQHISRQKELFKNYEGNVGEREELQSHLTMMQMGIRNFMYEYYHQPYFTVDEIKTIIQSGKIFEFLKEKIEDLKDIKHEQNLYYLKSTLEMIKDPFIKLGEYMEIIPKEL